MNNIFKVIWHYASQSWVVTSELSKSRGKAASRTTTTVKLSGVSAYFTYTAIASTILMATTPSFAATGSEGGSNLKGFYCYYDNTNSQSVVCGDATTSTVNTIDNKPAKSVVLGKGATNTGESNVAIGMNSASTATASVAIGNAASAKADQTVAIGQNASANAKWDIAIGRNTMQGATNSTEEGRNVAIGDGALKNGVNLNNNTAIGTDAGSSLTGSFNVAIGTYANSKTANKEILGNDEGITASNTVALGDRSLASENSAVSIGNRSQATALSAIAMGTTSKATGQYAVAQGSSAKATGTSSVAIGGAGSDSSSARATNHFSTAVGFNSISSGRNATALGSTTNATGLGSTALGSGANTTAGTGGAKTQATGAIAIGATVSNDASEKTVASGNQSIAIGVSATAIALNAIAQGTSAQATGENAIALGRTTQALGQNSIAQGVNAKVDTNGTNAIAIGVRANNNTGEITGNSSVALGVDTNAATNKAVAIGFNAKVQADTTTASDEQVGETNAQNGIAIGSDAKVSGTNALAIGQATTAKGQNGTAVGNDAHADGKSSVALGDGSDATKNAATALGAYAQATGEASLAAGLNAAASETRTIAVGADAQATAESATAIGNSAKGQKASSIAVGTNANSEEENAIAVGKDSLSKAIDAIAVGRTAQALQQYALAIGYNAVANGIDAVAFGRGSSATLANSIALGAYSVANVDKGAVGADPLSAGTDKTGSTWTSTHAAVSVGNGTEVTRQITSVAAGTNDTDAVNVAQLKAAGFKLQATQSQGEATSVTDDKILNGETVTFDAGKNIRITHTKGKVSIATSDDVEFNSVLVGNVSIDAETDKITGLADGELSADSTDAVNGSQLYATNQKVATNAANIATNTANIATNTANIATNTANIATNTANIATNTANIATNTANIAVLQAQTFKLQANGDTASAVKAGDTVQFIDGDNIKITRDGNNITVATARDVDFDSIIAADAGFENVQVGDNVTINGDGLAAGDVKVSIDGINAGNKVIEGVADGDISPTSKQAVNGSQIFALAGGTNNTRIGDYTVTNPDGTTTTYQNVVLDKDGNPALVTYNVKNGGEYITNNVITAINNMNTQGIKFFHTNDGEADTTRPTDQRYNNEDSSASGAYAVAVGYQSEASGTSSVAMGNNSTAAGDNAIAIGLNAEANAKNTISIGNGNIVNGENSGAFGDPSIIDATNSYSVGNNNNLAVGQSDVFALGNEITETTSNSVFLGSKSGSFEQAGSTKDTTTGVHKKTAASSYTYNGENDANVAGVDNAVGVVSVGNANETRQIQGVAAGVVSETSTDAINGSQLYYTNKAIGDVKNDINKLGDVVNKNNRQLRAGIAGANAAAGLPQVYLPGKSMVAASAGSFKGESALAVGYSRASDNGRVILKLQGNANTRGEVGGSVGVGYQW